MYNFGYNSILDAISVDKTGQWKSEGSKDEKLSMTWKKMKMAIDKDRIGVTKVSKIAKNTHLRNRARSGTADK